MARGFFLLNELVNYDTVKQSSLEKQYRKAKTENRYRTEKETMNLCYMLQRKYNIGLETINEGWFDHQVSLGEILGIDYRDLYLKAVNLENLFKSVSIQRLNVQENRS